MRVGAYKLTRLSRVYFSVAYIIILKAVRARQHPLPVRPIRPFYNFFLAILHTRYVVQTEWGMHRDDNPKDEVTEMAGIR
jgi:hypothetical protein